MAESTEQLKQEIRTLADEIRVRIHLAGMEAKDMWRDLSREAEKVSHHAAQVTRSALADVIDALRKFNESLKEI